MKFLTLGLLLMCGVPLIAHGAPDKPALRIPSNSKDWIRKEVSAIIHMTLEFVKDMDLKMRDVRRIERYYYGTMDFGAGRIYTAIGNKFDHMCSLYKNTSQISYIIEQERNLRSDVVGMLQFMLSDYMEFLSLIDLFKERYTHWKTSSLHWLLRDTIKKFLVSREIYPERWEEREDEWR
ncbi:uncharacterized protein LOC133532811 isoform X2 [Cydia pomonella]|uniref:uncharacterized protein LOC133532811 isoform X2 n=1 Tax=Cydia pomonella TaxID=82600 RepID=UPI002ADD6FA1|nr:uncharacterized protein LOC133532811 isoform X2 [Cydia pomonella]